MNIYLDIETIPSRDPVVREKLAAGISAPGNYKKPESITAWEQNEKPALVDEALAKTSFDGAYGQIVCAAIAVNDEEPRQIYCGDWDSARAEPVVLHSLFDHIIDATAGYHRQPTFIGHNILGFDLRFLFQRAVVHGIKPPAIIPFHAKPWSDDVFDTMTFWSGFSGRVGMDKLCQALGMEGKGDMDGSKVWDAVRDGKIKDVAEYCAADVVRTRALHRRLTFQVAA